MQNRIDTGSVAVMKEWKKKHFPGCYC